MNILFIGKRFYTNRDALTEKYGRIYQLPYHWSKEENIDIKLWLIDYHSLESVITKDEGLEIISTPVKNGSILRQYFKENYKKEKYDVVVASGDCYIGLLGYKLAKTHKAKFVFDVYDKYNTFSGYRNLFGINIYEFLLKKSDLCLFASKKLRNDSKKLCRQSIIVPNGIDQNIFYPRDKRVSRISFTLEPNELYIGYFGSMEVERGIDDLIDAVKIIRNNGLDLKILLAGKHRNNLDLNYSFINYLGNISFKDVSIAMACCDLLALPYRTSEFLDNASSCKIAEYLVMRIPIVATFSHNLVQNFNMEEKEIKFLAEKNNTNDYAEKLTKVLNNKILFSCKIDDYSWFNISNRCLFSIF